MNSKPIAISINETKSKMVKAINQIAKESNLPPSVLVCIMDSIKVQFAENAILEMQVLYEDVAKQGEK